MSSRYRPAKPFTSFILTTVQESKLNEDTTQSFKQLLTEHQHTFAKDTMDIGFCPLMQHDIDTGDAPPIKQSPRRPALGALDAEDTILDEMLSTGVIRPSSSEWASPVCLVKKEDGTCFCVDYRRVTPYLVETLFQSLTYRTLSIVFAVLNILPPSIFSVDTGSSA